MRVLRRVAGATCFLWFIGFVPAASAVDLRGLPWDELARGGEGAADDTRLPIQKAWRDQSQWKAFPCGGRYSYDMQIAMLLDRTDVNLNENGTVDVLADFRDLAFRGNGSYQAPQSLCIPFSGWFGVSADSARVRAVAWMVKVGDKEEIRLRVRETHLGTLHFGSAVPAWFERFVTDKVNAGLRWVWSSHLGEWISNKVAEAIKKELPNRRR